MGWDPFRNASHSRESGNPLRRHRISEGLRGFERPSLANDTSTIRSGFRCSAPHRAGKPPIALVPNFFVFWEEFLPSSLGRRWRELAICNWGFPIVDCRLLIDGGGCRNTSFSIGNQPAAAGQLPITSRQSAMKTWSLVAAVPRCPHSNSRSPRRSRVPRGEAAE